MKQSVAKRAVIGFAFLLGVAGAEEPLAGGITIRLYDYAGTPAGEVARAQEEARAIFARSKVRLTWLNCTLTPNGSPRTLPAMRCKARPS